ncbi:hypothetical protein [Flavobacterium sp. 3HN19-14]|uniref:hypothetical protein n=1 Tax=Flavobacterium sp. 3HN19-14 TaxID=3448133 RepID=UPI003EDF6BA2
MENEKNEKGELFTLPECSKFVLQSIAKHFKDIILLDYIKLIVQMLSSSILERNELLSFEQRNVSVYGELIPAKDNLGNDRIDKSGKVVYKKPYKSAVYNGLEFRVYETITFLSGSLHKYWNAGAHNHNDFDLNALIWVLNDLKEKFGVLPQHCTLRSLELGVNIIPPIPSNHIIENCFLHKTMPFENLKNSPKGKLIQVVHSQYIVKIYNKALHSRSMGHFVSGELLRFEIKFVKMEKFNKIGIKTLSDLIDKGFESFNKDLVGEWENVLFFDSTIQSKTKRLSNYCNPRYWTDLLKKSKSNFHKHRGLLRKLIVEHSNNIQNEVKEILVQKLQILNKGVGIDH